MWNELYVARPFTIAIQRKLKIKVRYILHVGVGKTQKTILILQDISKNDYHRYLIKHNNCGMFHACKYIDRKKGKIASFSMYILSQ